ncbi:MAG: DUF3050 domain-containing protein [Siphonobacter sp.]
MPLESLQERLAPLQKQLIDHSVYTQISSLEDLRVFTESHVFAVWDFMSLLKALQHELTCVEVPWIPKGSGSTAYLINEIVTGEESDVDQNGERMSHYELYLKAMRELSADTSRIEAFIRKLQAGASVEQALEELVIAEGVKDFVRFTFSVIKRNRPHEIASAFTFGREDLIPGMFIELVRNLNKRFPGQLDTFRYYLERHIEVDGDEHGHLATAMVQELCGNDEIKWAEATQVAEQALQQRIQLWTTIRANVVGVA